VFARFYLLRAETNSKTYKGRGKSGAKRGRNEQWFEAFTRCRTLFGTFVDLMVYRQDVLNGSLVATYRAGPLKHVITGVEDEGGRKSRSMISGCRRHQSVESFTSRLMVQNAGEKDGNGTLCKWTSNDV